jgi:hypothetical protein
MGLNGTMGTKRPPSLMEAYSRMVVWGYIKRHGPLDECTTPQQTSRAFRAALVGDNTKRSTLDAGIDYTAVCYRNNLSTVTFRRCQESLVSKSFHGALNAPQRSRLAYGLAYRGARLQLNSDLARFLFNYACIEQREQHGNFLIRQTATAACLFAVCLSCTPPLRCCLRSNTNTYISTSDTVSVASIDHGAAAPPAHALLTSSHATESRNCHEGCMQPTRWIERPALS